MTDTAAGQVSALGRVGRLPELLEVEATGEGVEAGIAYWLVDDSGRWLFTAAEIARHAGWPAHETAKRVRALVTARDSTSACPSCGALTEVTSRSDLTARRSRYSYAPPACGDCRRRAAEEIAEQRRAAEAEEARRRNELAADVAEHFALRDTEPLHVTEQDLRHVIALLALLRRADHDLVRTLPLAEWPASEPYAPISLDAAELVRQLWRCGLLRVHPASPPDAFGYTPDGELGIFVEKTSFVVTGSGPTGPRNATALRALYAAIAEPWTEDWRAAAADLTSELLLADALDYLDLQMSEHGFELKVGERTRLAVARALEHFSLGSVYNIVNRAARNSAAYYQRSGVPKQQAANSVVSRVDGDTDRALAEKWDLKPYRRDWRLPMSVLLSTFFVTALSVGDVMAAKPEELAAAIAAK